MAGIHVSGGIYSGSGDVTADWLWLEYHSAGTQKVWLPDGTLTLTSEKSNYALRNDWCGSSDNWQHQNGTVKVTYGGGTTLYLAGAAPVVTGRDGQLYNLIINQNANPRATDPVLINTIAVGGNYTVIENSLSIISGTARIGDADVTNYTKLGHIFIGASGTFSAGDVADVNNGGYNNWDSSGSIYAKTVIFSGTNSVFVGNGGNIVFTGPYAGNDSDHYVWENPTLGTYYHNGGTIQFGGGDVYGPGETSQYSSYMNFKNLNRQADGTGQTSNGDGGWFYNISGGFRDQDTPDRHLGIQLSAQNSLKVSNNFSLMSGASIDTSTYNITVSGTVFLDENAYWGNYATQGGTKTIGALYMANGGNYFKAPTGSLTINKETGDSYKFRIENNGTFVHNSGTIVLDASTVGGMYKNTGSNGKYLYNLIVKNDNTSSRAVQNVYDVTVANDLIVSGAGSDADDWDVGFYNAGDGGVIASGTTTIVSGAKLGRSSQNNTFGKLILGKKGWFDAGTGTTTLQGATAGSDRARILQTKSDSLFTHNSGTIDFSCATAGQSTAYIWLDGKSIADPFWNTTINGNTGIHSYTWYKFYAGSSGVITLEGDTAKAHNGSAVFELGNSSTLQLGRTGASMLFGPMNWFYGQSSSETVIKSVDTLFPAYISGTSNNKILGTSGDSYTPLKTTLQDIKLHDLEGELKGNLHLSGQCQVEEDLTVNSDGVLTVENGQLAEFDNSLIIDGTFVGSGSLLIVDDKLKTNSTSTIYNSGTAAIIGHGGTSTVRFNRGTWETVMLRNTGEVQFDTNSNTAVNFIAAGGIVNTMGMHFNSDISNTIIANGGTLTHNAAGAGIFKTTDFSNRGGLFASSSALYPNGGFGGANTGYMAFFPYAAAQQPTAGAGESFTVEGWFKANSAGYEVLARSYGNGNWMFLNNANGDKMGFYVDANDGSSTAIYPDEVLPYDGSWIHIAGVAGDTFQTLYYDGKLVASGTKATGVKTNSGGWAIGTNPNSGANPWNYMFAGYCGMLRVWDGTCTPAEIRANMFDETPTAAGATLKANVMFNDGEGEVVTDEAGNGNGYLSGSSTPFSDAWATGGTWTAGGVLGDATEVIAGNLYIGNHGAYATEFSESYFPTGNINFVSGAKLVSKAHSGTTSFYVDAADGATFEFDKMSLEPASVDRATHTGGSEMELISGDYTYIFNEGENDQGTAKDTDTLTVNSPVTVKALTGVDFYVQDFVLKPGALYPRTPTYDGQIHDDGSLPQEYEPIDFKQHVDDTPIDAGLAID